MSVDTFWYINPPIEYKKSVPSLGTDDSAVPPKLAQAPTCSNRLIHLHEAGNGGGRETVFLAPR